MDFQTLLNETTFSTMSGSETEALKYKYNCIVSELQGHYYAAYQVYVAKFSYTLLAPCGKDGSQMEYAAITGELFA